MRATVIIPCLNAQETLGAQLDALSRQVVGHDVELIVVDNGSVDRSREVAQSFTGRFPAFHVIETWETRGAAHARNVGAQAAKGELLLFCDADDVVGAGWLPAMIRALESHDGVVASRFDYLHLNPLARGQERTTQTRGLQDHHYPPFLPHAGGSGLGVHASVHRSIGGFDESLRVLEDTDYCWRAQLAGFPLRFAEEAVVHVRIRTDLVDEWRQRVAWGEGNVGLYARYRGQGMPRVRLRFAARSWLRLLRRAPDLASRDRRHRWLGHLAFRLGRVKGCFRYRVLAP